MYPDRPRTLEQVQHDRTHRDPRCRYARWSVDLDGHLVGVGDYDQAPEMLHPRKFWIALVVHPQFQGRGIGTALFAHLCAALERFNPLYIGAEAREEQTRALRFLSDRGFHEVMRLWDAELDVAAFEATAFAEVADQLASDGVRIVTLADLADDPNCDAKLYDLVQELEADLPMFEPATVHSYDYFVAHTLGNPDFIPEVYFVALDGDRFVGTTSLLRNPVQGTLYNYLTGVRREARRLGIALALKLRGIAYAQQHGYARIATDNASLNQPMVSLNERLGFRRLLGSIWLVKPWSDEYQLPLHVVV